MRCFFWYFGILGVSLGLYFSLLRFSLLFGGVFLLFKNFKLGVRCRGNFRDALAFAKISSPSLSMASWLQVWKTWSSNPCFFCFPFFLFFRFVVFLVLCAVFFSFPRILRVRQGEESLFFFDGSLLFWKKKNPRIGASGYEQPPS